MTKNERPPPITLVLSNADRTVSTDPLGFCRVNVPPMPQTDGPFYMQVNQVSIENLTSGDNRLTVHCDLGQASKYETSAQGVGTIVGTIFGMNGLGTEYPKIYCHRRNPNQSVLMGLRYTFNNAVPTLNRLIFIITITPA